MKNIIILYPYFRPAYKAGGPIQSLANLAKALTSQGLTVKVITSNIDHDGTTLPVPTNTWVKEQTTGAEAFYTSKGHRTIRLLKNLIDKEAVVFSNGIYEIWFNILPILLKRKVIISVRGMLHPGALSQKRTKKKIYLTAWKFLGLHKKCTFHATALEEQTFIQNIFGHGVKISVVPNIPRILDFEPNNTKKPSTLRLITIALISPMKNHLLVLQALQNCLAEVEYYIYGPVKDEEYWQQCLEAIKHMPQNVKVYYKGDIEPHNLPVALSQGDVAILPSKSENFGHSIFEALSAGKPTIVSHNTPWNSLEIDKAGMNVSIEGVSELAKAIEQFAAMDAQSFSEWNAGARRLADNSFNEKKIVHQYLQLFN